MTIHPEFCDLVLFNTRPATTPSPNRISSPVPIASAVKLFMTTPFSRRQAKQPGPLGSGEQYQAHPPFSRQRITGGRFVHRKPRSFGLICQIGPVQDGVRYRRTRICPPTSGTAPSTRLTGRPGEVERGQMRERRSARGTATAARNGLVPLGAAFVLQWVNELAFLVRDQRDYLTQLDAAIGDADH